MMIFLGLLFAVFGAVSFGTIHKLENSNQALAHKNKLLEHRLRTSHQLKKSSEPVPTMDGMEIKNLSGSDKND